MNVVLDASAMIAFLRDETGAEAVMNQMRRPECNAFAHALNLCEVYYDFSRASGEATASGAINDLFALGIGERNDMHPSFWRAMGRLKASHKRVSLADCAALALAADLDAVLLSADRHELEPLRAKGSASCNLSVSVSPSSSRKGSKTQLSRSESVQAVAESALHLRFSSKRSGRVRPSCCRSVFCSAVGFGNVAQTNLAAICGRQDQSRSASSTMRDCPIALLSFRRNRDRDHARCEGQFALGFGWEQLQAAISLGPAVPYLCQIAGLAVALKDQPARPARRIRGSGRLCGGECVSRVLVQALGW